MHTPIINQQSLPHRFIYRIKMSFAPRRRSKRTPNNVLIWLLSNCWLARFYNIYFMHINLNSSIVSSIYLTYGISVFYVNGWMVELSIALSMTSVEEKWGPAEKNTIPIWIIDGARKTNTKPDASQKVRKINENDTTASAKWRWKHLNISFLPLISEHWMLKATKTAIQSWCVCVIW